MKNQHPYSNLDATKFWRETVFSLDKYGAFDGLWQPKFSINKQTKFITLGSCFAQHISRWLLKNNYMWLEGEMPAPKLSDEEKTELGYGVFSFRTGNIYTPKLLRQWLELATADLVSINETFEEEGRYFDPLRPNIPKSGFGTKQELFDSRRKLLEALTNTISKTDVFIFTLGLTEAWLNRSGYIYPVCPGTIRGTFSLDQHIFKNFSYHEIVEDLTKSFEICRQLNPKIKFLLTVSPVPLTATASENHVLTSSTYSKAVLRAAAGQLAATHDDVDYFPSFEIISTHLMKGQLFESNMRTVKKEGVDLVMRHFENGLTGIRLQTDLKKETISTSASEKKDEDLVCEDILLETWLNQGYESDIDICLIGDSHMGKLSQSLDKLNIKHMGGMIMNGSAWTSNLLHTDDEEIFVPLENSGARSRWQKTLPFFSDHKSQKFVVTNICMQTHRSVSFMTHYFKKNNMNEYNLDNFIRYFLDVNKTKLEVLGKVGDRLDVTLIVVTDPPTQGGDPVFPAGSDMLKLFEFYDLMVEAVFEHLGCQVFNARKYFDLNNFNPMYYSDTIYADGARDWFHGSDVYYLEVAKELVQRIHLSRKTLQ